MNLSSKGGIIAYGVIAGVMWVVWVAAIFIGERRRAGRGVAKVPVKYSGSPRGSDSVMAEAGAAGGMRGRE